MTVLTVADIAAQPTRPASLFWRMAAVATMLLGVGAHRSGLGRLSLLRMSADTLISDLAAVSGASDGPEHAGPAAANSPRSSVAPAGPAQRSGRVLAVTVQAALAHCAAPHCADQHCADPHCADPHRADTNCADPPDVPDSGGGPGLLRPRRSRLTAAGRSCTGGQPPA